MTRKLRNFAMGVASAALMFAPTLNVHAFAATTQAHPRVLAEVSGKPYPAILVGTGTYVSSDAFQALKTPNEYLGSGKFAVTGGTVQGVVYQGKTFVPWNAISSQVKATKLPGGGFNFTPVSVAHHYRIVAQTSNAVVGSPTVLELMVIDADAGGVPHQQIKIHVNGASYISGPPNSSDLSDYTDQSGQWVGTIDDATAESVQPTVTWTDPSGKVQTTSLQVTFKAATPISTQTPADEKVVSTVPITVFDSAVFLNAQSGGNDVAFQLDTGAFSPVITKRIADSLHLPDLGDMQVEGIGGLDNAYLSKITLSIGGVEFKDISCVVDENYTGSPLLGYSFFTDNGYDILVSQKHQTLSILN